MATRYHAIIVGGGPAGCAAAIGLVRAGARVLLLERSVRPADKPGEIIDASIRSSCRALGLDDHLFEANSLVLAGRLIDWRGEGEADMAGMLNPLGDGCIVRRSDFERQLLAAARSSGVAVVTGTHGAEARREGAAWHVGYRAGTGARLRGCAAVDRSNRPRPWAFSAAVVGSGSTGWSP